MKKQQELIEWWHWSLYYIGAAKDLNELVLNKKDSKNLIVPAVYCFKHGLELFLKFLILNLPEKDFKKIHDLTKLRSDSLGIEFNSKQINNIKKILSEEDIEIGNYQDVKKFMEKQFTNIINRYSNFRVGKSKVRDSDNDLFRYPKNKKLIKWLQTADETKVKELSENISKDIKNAGDFISTFLFLHSNFLQKMNE